MPFETPREFPGELVLTDEAGDPASIGGMTRNGDNIRMRDQAGVFNPRPSDAGEVQPTIETFSTSSTSYVTVATFYYGGSLNWGAPQNIKVVGFVSAGTGKFRVIDLTNGSAVVAEVTGVTDTVAAIINLGTISNVPSAEAVWALQMAKDTSGTIDVKSANLDFFLTEGGAEVSSGIPFTDNVGNRGVLNLTLHEPVPVDRPAMTEDFFATYAHADPVRFSDDVGVSGTLLITAHEPIPADRPNMTSGFAI